MADVLTLNPAYSQDAAFVVRMRCPLCRHVGTFESTQASDLHNGAGGEGRIECGLRRCPNPECHAIVFFVARGSVLSDAYPAERIDFDTTSLPAVVLTSLTEAITCEAVGCHRAAAIMVRRTLEDVCADRGATGGNLKERLQSLGAKIVVPKELLDGLDNLRLLGNDAAHIEAQTYEEVGQEEVTLAIDVTKELLKAVYQYGSLVARLDALKRATGE